MKTNVLIALTSIMLIFSGCAGNNAKVMKSLQTGKSKVDTTLAMSQTKLSARVSNSQMAASQAAAGVGGGFVVGFAASLIASGIDAARQSSLESEAKSLLASMSGNELRSITKKSLQKAFVKSPKVKFTKTIQVKTQDSSKLAKTKVKNNPLLICDVHYRVVSSEEITGTLDAKMYTKSTESDRGSASPSYSKNFMLTKEVSVSNVKQKIAELSQELSSKLVADLNK